MSLVKPNSTAYLTFQIEKSGQAINADSGEFPTAFVYRNGILTAITATVTNLKTGLYLVSFTVPSDWQEYDAVFCNFLATVSGMNIELTKEVGTVSNLNSEDISLIKSLLMLTEGKTVTHNPDQIIIGDNEVVINLTIDEINNTVVGERTV